MYTRTIGAEDSIHVAVVAGVRGTQLPDRHDTRVGVHRSRIESNGCQCGNELRRRRWSALVHVRHVRRADGSRALSSARVSLLVTYLPSCETLALTVRLISNKLYCVQTPVPEVGAGAADSGALAAQLRFVPLGVSVAAARDGRAHRAARRPLLLLVLFVGGGKR